MADATLHIRVIPRSSRNQITGWRDGVLQVKLTAPPVEGAANESLIKFLADSLGIRRSQITLSSGDRSRSKTLKISGLTEDDVKGRLGS